MEKTIDAAELEAHRIIARNGQPAAVIVPFSRFHAGMLTVAGPWKSRLNEVVGRIGMLPDPEAEAALRAEITAAVADGVPEDLARLAACGAVLDRLGVVIEDPAAMIRAGHEERDRELGLP